jgi:hypothetical protein
MLIDDFLPKYDVVENHQIVVRATAEKTYGAIRTADLGGAIPVKVLLAIRALPGALASGARGLSRLRQRGSQRIRLEDFEHTGFSVLAENPPRELLIGLVGAFWKPSGGLCSTDAGHFRGPQEKGTARAAWNFAVDDLADGTVRLSTETRVETADPGSARSFRAYWLIVRPGSGLIRRYMLKAIRREAESA